MQNLRLEEFELTRSRQLAINGAALPTKPLERTLLLLIIHTTAKADCVLQGLGKANLHRGGKLAEPVGV